MSRRTLAVLWTLLILVACSIPGHSLPSTSLLEYDKLIHFTLFVVLGGLWFSAFPKQRLTIFLLGVLYAGGTELYQGLPFFDRHPDPFDFIANTLGLTTALLLSWILGRRRTQK